MDAHHDYAFQNVAVGYVSEFAAHNCKDLFFTVGLKECVEKYDLTRPAEALDESIGMA